MKRLQFKIDINASAKKVWDKMLNPESFREWVSAGFPGAYYIGKWGKGENIKFLSCDQGGTIATIDEFREKEYILARHVAVINPDKTQDTTSDVAKGWIGTTEAYRFIEHNGKTELKIEIETFPEWESMFSEGWPANLKKLKEMVERSRVEATAEGF